LTVDVEVGGRRRRVVARREGAGWVVSIDGRELSIDLAASKGQSSLLLREPGREGSEAPALRVHHRSHAIAIETHGDGEYTVSVDGQAVRARVAPARTLFGRRGRESSTADGPARVTSPMPGRVVKVLVQPGDTAASGQPLVVVEAMKMENELRAPRGGVVTEVLVGEGTSIEANTVLIVLE
jgi:biotin carboxyl carrier protein